MTLRPKLPAGSATSVIEPTRIAWTLLRSLSVRIGKHPEGELEQEPGETITLSLLRFRNTINIPLTAFTEAELDCFQGMVTEAVELARPICAARDRHAQTEWEETGDTAYDRIYRPVPQVNRRPGRQ